MADAIRHRGPDDEGRWLDGEIGLGHRRLSIIDVEGGRQPLSNEDGSVWIVFNGEIYNFVELREELERKGHRFHSRTDTEVIVHLYEEEGERAVERLRGMFAFAIWDVKERRLFLARDRLGQKPLFYARRGDRFLFASEIKALLKDSSIRGSLNATALASYLSLRFVPSPLTMFEGIHSLPPAHTLIYQDGKARIRRYWSLKYLPKRTASEADLVDELEEVLTDAVRSHLMSDVPLGTFLSGGIDSGLMTALAARNVGRGLPTFSVGSDSQEFSEIPMARDIARRYATEHHEAIACPDLISFLPVMVHHLDMPGDPIAACQYYAAQLAGRSVKVVLGGDGGDELFGGYDRYAGFKWIDAYAAVPEWLRSGLIGPLLDRAGDSFGYKSTIAKLRWAQDLARSSGGARYAASTTHFRFDRERLSALAGPTLERDLREQDPCLPIIAAFDAVDDAEVLDRMLNADVMTRLPEHLLVLVDRMTMSQSIEGRLPMLDHPVVEFAARLPTRLKLRGRQLKVLLRRVAERHLPPDAVRRPKQGFMFPIASWLRDDLMHAVRRMLLESRLVEEGVLRRPALSDLMEEHLAGRVDHHHRIWMLLNLEIWFRHFLDGEGLAQLEDRIRRHVSDDAGFSEVRPIRGRGVPSS